MADLPIDPERWPALAWLLSLGTAEEYERFQVAWAKHFPELIALRPEASLQLVPHARAELAEMVGELPEPIQVDGAGVRLQDE